MKNMPMAGTLVRFIDIENVEHIGYVTRRDVDNRELRVCVGTGNYYTVDSDLAVTV